MRRTALATLAFISMHACSLRVASAALSQANTDGTVLCSGSDLLHTALDGTPSLTGNWTGESASGAPGALYDGVACYAGGAVTPRYKQEKTQYGAPNNSSTVTFTLDLAASPDGYRITQIDFYHGWGDDGRDGMEFVIEYSVVGDGGFSTYGTTTKYDPPSNYGRARITDDTGTIATDVDQIRITAQNIDAGMGGVAEIDIFGQIVSDVDVQPIGGGTAVDEDGTPGTDTYEVVLKTQPTDNVTVTPGFDGSQLTVSPSSLTFTSANYDNAQTCTVTVVDDAVIEQTHDSTITHSVASDDSNYDGIAAPSLLVTITDDDVPGTTTTTSDGVVDCASDDLLQTALDSVAITGTFSDGGEPVLRDGEALYDGDTTGTPSYQTAAKRATIGNDRVATYTLDTTAGPRGYDIEQIDVYHGWSDDGRDKGLVTVHYSFLRAPDVYYTIVSSASYDPPSNYGRIRLTPATGTYFANNVAKVRITFPATQENGAAGYSEIDVIGRPTPGALPGTVFLFK